jgi:hypothetical protein
MTIDVNGRTMLRAAAIAAAAVGVGAASFFGGQATRMDDTARANERRDAVNLAVAKADNEHAAQLAEVRLDAKAHEKRAVKRAVKRTMKKERKRAAKLAERARSEGYSSGNTAGYGAGHSAGYSEGNEAGVEEGIDEGIDIASDDLTCSDDPDVPLPYCEDW